MHRKTIRNLLAFLVATVASHVLAQGTAFMYQGQLGTNGVPISGPYDFQFSLFDNATAGNLVAGPKTNLNVIVANGLFTTTLDFGPVFTGTNYWLGIGVRTNNGAANTNAFTALTPRQPVLPVPYAMFATSASNLLGAIPAGQLTGMVPSASITGNYSSTVNFTNGANSFTGNYFGNGGGVTNLNGSQIASGTVPNARLSSDVAFTDSNQLFHAVNTFSNRNNSFTGNFFGNGLVGWVGVSTTVTQAVPNTGYIIGISNLVTVIMPPGGSLFPGDVVRIADPYTGGWLAIPNVGQTFIGSFFSYSNSLWQTANIPAAGNWHCMASAQSGAPMYAGSSGGSGTIVVSKDGGATWSQTGITGTSWFGVACSLNGMTVYAAPNSGVSPATIEKSTDGGVNWNGTMGSRLWTAVACSGNGSNIVAAVTNGSIFVSSNGGISSNAIAGVVPAVARWTTVTCSADGSRMAAAANNGNIYYALNGAWSDSGKKGSWVSMASSSDGTHLVACTETNTGGFIFTSADGGATWTQTAAPNAFWNCVACSADGSRLIAGPNNTNLYASANFGATWTPLATTNALWGCIACSADGSKIAAGNNTTAGNIFYTGVSSSYIQTGSTNGIGGTGGSAVELLYTGSSFMPVSSSGVIWAN